MRKIVFYKVRAVYYTNRVR